MKTFSRACCALFILFLFSSVLFAESGYRGRRYHGEHHEDRFYIEKIYIGEYYITVYFNQPINPSFNPEENIIIHGRHLPRGTLIKYNKKGTQLTIQLPDLQRKIELEDIEIKGLSSYCGMKLEEYRFTNTPHKCGECYTEKQY